MHNYTIIPQIKNYGQTRDIGSLQAFIERTNTNEITSEIRPYLPDPTFITFWNYFLQGFDLNNNELCKKYFDVISFTLEQLQNVSVSNAHAKSIISRLIIELPKFKTDYLLKFIAHCIKCIQVGNITRLIWVDLLPELLNIVSGRDTVCYNDVTYTGSEYKSSVIDSLCMLEWSSNIITSLAVMFKDISLSKEEHHKVVSKLLQYVESLTCLELPTFIHNMLKFCKYLHSKYIFFKLQHYFHIRIYSLNSCNSQSDIDSMDLIGVVAEPSALEAEANVLFHIHQAAIFGYESIKEYVHFLKSLVNVHEFILHPFQVVVLLTISQSAQFEELVFDVIKSCVTKGYKEEQKQNESCWLREILPHDIAISNVFEQILQFNNEHKQAYIKQGLMSLGFVFLGINIGFGNDVIVEKQWKLGLMLLLEVTKVNRNNANFIIHQICDNIVTKQNVTPYIECLHMLCRKQALTLLENQSCILELMESLIQISNKNGIHILQAISPMTKISTILKDQLILILRKALFSRRIESRQVAVSGFVDMLKNVKIRDPTALSLSDSSSLSGHSLLTQISLSRSGQFKRDILTGESLTLEILNILKRCFMQQADVKTHLYEGLREAASVNPHLALPILELLLPQFLLYYQHDLTIAMPFNYNEAIVLKDQNVIIMEPLGKLIQLIGYLVTIASTNEEANAATKFINILDKLCERMIKCSLSDYQLTESDLTNITQKQNILTREAMIVLNALINYKINTWTTNSVNQAETISSLYDSYHSLFQFFKNTKQSKKNEKKKTDNDTTTSTNADTSFTTKIVNFKVSDIEILSVTLVKILQLLYLSEINWATTEEINILKAKKEFHQYIIQGVINYIESINSNNSLHTETQQKTVYNYLEKITNILYNGSLMKFKNIIEFDEDTATLTLEAFYNIMQFKFSKFQDESAFFENICNDVDNSNFDNNLQKVIETVISIFEDNDVADDANTRKMNHYCLNILLVLSTKIPKQNNLLSNKVLDWLKAYSKRTMLTNKQTVTNLANLIFNLNLRFKKATMLYENVAKNLANLFGANNLEHETIEEYLLINENTRTIFLQALCNSFKKMLDDFDWLILRMKAECIILTYTTHEEDSTNKKNEELKRKERDICCQMCWLMNILNILSGLQITSQSDHLIKNLIHTFTTLNSLTKYFTLRSTKENLVFEEARFDKVVKLAGKQLCRTIYNLILFLDENQIPKDGVTQNKRETNVLKSKILKETKLIPKLVFEIEQFSKSVMQLSNKTKVDLTKYTGQGISRDFRILNIEAILRNVQDDTEVTDLTTENSSDVRSLFSDEESCSTSCSKRARLS